MKKIIVCILLVVMVVMLTSCMACIRGWSPPYGIWHNEELNITLFIDEELSLRADVFPGIYVQYSKIMDITIVIESKSSHIYVYESSIFAENSWRDYLFFGWYRVEDDRLYFEVDRYNSEPSDIGTIVFERLEQALMIRWFLSIIDR